MNEACLCFDVLFLENTPLHLVSCLAYCISAYLHTGTYILMCIYELLELLAVSPSGCRCFYEGALVRKMHTGDALLQSTMSIHNYCTHASA